MAIQRNPATLARSRVTMSVGRDLMKDILLKMASTVLLLLWGLMGAAVGFCLLALTDVLPQPLKAAFLNPSLISGPSFEFLLFCVFAGSGCLVAIAFRWRGLRKQFGGL